MKIKIMDSSKTGGLIEALEARVDATVTRIASDELEVSLSGSRTLDVEAEELRRRVAEWGTGAVVLRQH